MYLAELAAQLGPWAYVAIFATIFAETRLVVAPFVAGAARMELHRLMLYAAVAAALWVTIFLGAGYWFGTAARVQDYLAVALVAVVAASMLPGLVIWALHRLRRGRTGAD